MCLKYGNRLCKGFVKIFNFFVKFRIFVRYTLSPMLIPSGTDTDVSFLYYFCSSTPLDVYKVNFNFSNLGNVNSTIQSMRYLNTSDDSNSASVVCNSCKDMHLNTCVSLNFPFVKKIGFKVDPLLQHCQLCKNAPQTR